MTAPSLHSALSGKGRSSAKAFWQLMQHIAVAAGLTHLAFIGIFYSLGAQTMALVNVGSVLLFAASLHCLRRRQNLAGAALIVLELVMHAVLAVRSLGWDSGFHYYLLDATPVLVISRMPWRWIKPTVLTSLVALYLGMDHWMRLVPPLDQVSAATLSVVRGFNIVCTFALLAFLAHTYFKLVRRAEAAMLKLATTDPLTELLNRRSLLERAADLCTRSPHIAFILADIDHFKAINDQHGHAAGDAVLVAVSQALQQAVRAEDSVARWGGEEFLVMMPGTDLATAHSVAERLRQDVAAITVPFEGQLLHVSMTLGVSHLRHGEALDAPVQRADAALYRGKVAGRNRVVDETQTDDARQPDTAPA